MKKQLAAVCCGFLMLLLFPYIVTLVWSGKVEGTQKRNEFHGGLVIIEDLSSMAPMDREEFLIGVVAAQMPADYEPEALRAQAIIARTYLSNKMNGAIQASASSLNIKYWTPAECKKQWGKEEYTTKYEKVKNAVLTTSKQILMYEGKKMDPMFHSASSGQTRGGDELHPYFVAVSSAGDVEMDGYLTISTWEKQDFASRMKLENSDNITESIQIIERDGSGYVMSIQAGNLNFTGEQVQNALDLPSSCFTIELFESKIRIICKGIGHGYGLSQWGSNKLALNGLAAEEILSYYYKNIEIISE